jgi:tetratricopeptide (TPR) repeat protein
MIAAMSPQLREGTQARWYLSIGYTELGLLLFSAQKDREGLAAHRKAASLFESGIPAEWTKDPEKVSHLSRLWRELSVSMWMAEGYTPGTETMARAAVDAVHECDAPNCRMRRAQSKGTLGEIEWAGGKKDQAIATLRASLAEFEVLAGEDPKNAVFQNAAAQVRSYLALMLAGGPFREEAVTLAGKSAGLAAGADAGQHRARERLMVRQITLGAALLGAGRLDEGVHQLRETIERNRDWDVNWDLVWSALHLLAVTFEKTSNYQEELTVAEEETKHVLHDPANNLRVMAAIAARDYAAAVAHWKDASPSDRAKALQGLEASNGLDERYAGLTGALLERPPAAADLAAIRTLLR